MRLTRTVTENAGDSRVFRGTRERKDGLGACGCLVGTELGYCFTRGGERYRRIRSQR